MQISRLKPLRVGYLLNHSETSLLGATNYYHNLLKSISQSECIQPVILTAGDLPQSICNGLPPLEVVVNPFATIHGKKNVMRRAAGRILSRDFIFDHILRQNNIDVLSHSGSIGRFVKTSTTPWIADFQHRKLPDFFSSSELKQRDRYFERTARNATLLIVSSHSAKNDCIEFLPKYAHKVRVLQFVAPLQSATKNSSEILSKYDLSKPYFLVPNQFWKHKNHKIIIDALTLLRRNGTPMSVVATGHTMDRRHPEYFPSLQADLKKNGCHEDFRILGVVPYGDVAALLQNCVAVINPSLFEGWSTSVEEAKNHGKSIILSNIAVHQEQAPAKAYFFEPNDAAELAVQMEAALTNWSPQTDLEDRLAAEKDFHNRQQRFISQYEEILHEAASINNSKIGLAQG